jgi:nitrous oxidase accessory protein NosD
MGEKNVDGKGRKVQGSAKFYFFQEEKGVGMEVCNRLVKVCVLSLLLWSAFAFAAELYVPTVYPTIQAAINAANSGDTIIVAAGTYRENLNITKSITIRGVDRNLVILEPTVAGYGIGIAGAGNTVTIENITIKAGSAKFFMVHVSGISSFRIENVKIEGAGKTVTPGGQPLGGLDLNGVSNVVIRDVEISDVSRNGVSLTNTVAATLENVDVHDTGISEGWAGVAIYTTQVGNFSVNFTGRNTVTNTPKGIYIEDVAGATISLTAPAGTVAFSGQTVAPLVKVGPGSTPNLDNIARGLGLVGKVYSPEASPPYNTGVAFFATVEEALGAAVVNPALAPYSIVYDLASNQFVVGPGMQIQRALNVAQNGDVISVKPGTYVAQQVIDESLTLQGSGWGTSGTIIQAPNTLTQYFTTGTYKNFPIIYVHDADNVTIRDLVVDGAGKGNANYRFIGIAYYNAGGTIDHVEIVGIRDTPLSGAQHGVGIYAYNADGTPRTLTISDSFIHDFQKNGMALFGNGLTVRVEGNIVVGIGPTNRIAQNGIQVTYGAGGLILGNVVRDVWWTGGYWTSSGILVGWTDADLEIRENEVSGAQTGIYAGDTTGQLIIRYNRIANGYWNVILYNTPGAVLQFNSITGSDDGSWTDSSPNATLNWWGSPNGPTVDEDEDGTFEYVGGGETLYGNFIYSPWLGTDPDGDPSRPGVQVTGPVLIVVDDVGPAPAGGYLNQAIAGANELPYADTIEVRHGTYNASTPITGPVTLISQPGSTTNTFLNGNLTLSAAGILIGRMGQGFTINADITVTPGTDASTIHINWNDIYGTVTNNGVGTLDATYNWWGGRYPATAVVGAVNYYPYLPLPVSDMLKYMSDHRVDADTAIFLIERGGLVSEGLLVLSLMNRFGLSRDEAERVVDEFGFLRVGFAFDRAFDYDDFVRLLLGYGATPAGGAGAFVDRGVAGGAGMFGDRVVDAVYEIGQPILVSFELSDFQGNPVTGIGAWVTLVQLHEDGHQTIWYWNATRYNPETGLQELSIPTEKLPEGYFLLVINFRDGTKTESLIQIVK